MLTDSYSVMVNVLVLTKWSCYTGTSSRSLPMFAKTRQVVSLVWIQKRAIDFARSCFVKTRKS